jgi:Cu-Zn family superoxide dismutase
VTDSTRPTLWRAAAGAITPGASTPAEAWLDFTGTPLVYQSGFNLNGIVVTPDNRFLIVSQTNTGKLFRIDLATRAIVQINLGSELVPGDGLQIRGHTLWAVAGGQIVKVQLSGDWASGTVASRTSNASFSSPTTNALARGRMLVVNSQFANRGGTPTLPFTVSSIRIP